MSTTLKGEQMLCFETLCLTKIPFGGALMFQDIGDDKIDTSYRRSAVKASDYIICFDSEGLILFSENDQTVTLPTFEMVAAHFHANTATQQYLCSFGDRSFFFTQDEQGELKTHKGFSFQSARTLFAIQPSWLAFAGATSLHLAYWYKNNRYCGRCAHKLLPGSTERTLFCSSCGLTIYPKINPVVIVGIIDGEKLLLTKYSHGSYRNFALVAGFMEIGETFEDTVKREVMEEVGLRVKNIRYYQSQPWAFSESVLAGFFAEVDGDSTVTVDHNELSQAVWFDRSELPTSNNAASLTEDMMEAFRTRVIEE
jgi:NAD+ diphosphatase